MDDAEGTWFLSHLSGQASTPARMVEDVAAERLPVVVQSSGLTAERNLRLILQKRSSRDTPPAAASSRRHRHAD